MAVNGAINRPNININDNNDDDGNDDDDNKLENPSFYFTVVNSLQKGKCGRLPQHF